MSEMIFSAWPLLMAPAPTDGSQPPAWVQLLPLVILFVLMYFVLLRPQMKRQKEQEKLISAVKTGDRVVAAGGILGTVTNVSMVFDVTVAFVAHDWIAIALTCLTPWKTCIVRVLS